MNEVASTGASNVGGIIGGILAALFVIAGVLAAVSYLTVLRFCSTTVLML